MSDHASVDTETTATVTLRLPPTAVHVRTARLVAAAMARRSGVDEALLDEVRLAVGEACARAVRLHERLGLADPVVVEFDDRDRFVVSVVDEAPNETAVLSPTVVAADGHANGVGGTAVSALLPGAALSAPWADPTGEALGLALLGAVVQDLSVRPEHAGAGSRVVMSWPLALA